MPRRRRVGYGGFVYHVLNRSVGRATLFHKPQDYAAFERVIEQVHRRLPVRLLTYCLMPNHWHLVLWPEGDGDLSEFMRLLTVTHTQRYHAHYHTAGTGPLYQGRFKSFPIQEDRHLLLACRYVERNPLRANLVEERAEAWAFGSAHRRLNASPPAWLMAQSDWPTPVPTGWRDWVNAAESPAELAAVRRSAKRGAPLGDDQWQRQTAERLDLLATLTPRGRPKRKQNSTKIR